MHPQPPAEDVVAVDEFPPADFPALNTESCKVFRLLAHFGHSIFWLEDITMRS
ncbi:MAG TPA: hypothetical protein VGI34_05300 [Candidatus Acidoferrales bacterium]